MRDYSLHIQMFKFMKARYPDVKLALHAGELALGMVPPEGLKFHITEAVGVAGAQRIGHGIDISHERDALRLIQTLRERDIPIEVNLTSNEFILGVKGAAHPVELYRKHGVPFIISTDDSGVTRHTLSNEYVLFASRYKPTYTEVKKLSYDSLRYAFLPEADKQRLKKQLDTRFAKFEADIAASEARALKPVRRARDVQQTFVHQRLQSSREADRPPQVLDPVLGSRGLFGCHPRPGDIGDEGNPGRLDPYLAQLLGEWRQGGLHHGGVEGVGRLEIPAGALPGGECLVQGLDRGRGPGDDARVRAVPGFHRPRSPSARSHCCLPRRAGAGPG